MTSGFRVNHDGLFQSVSVLSVRSFSVKTPGIMLQNLNRGPGLHLRSNQKVPRPVRSGKFFYLSST